MESADPEPKNRDRTEAAEPAPGPGTRRNAPRLRLGVALKAALRNGELDGTWPLSIMEVDGNGEAGSLDIAGRDITNNMSVHEAIEVANSILPGVPALDGQNDPRWQAIIDVSEYIDSDPEEIWRFIVRWGTHLQADLRTAIRTCLLEHILEEHFDLIFPKVSELVKENPLFADTFVGCWKFGQADQPENSRKIDELADWYTEQSGDC